MNSIQSQQPIYNRMETDYFKDTFYGPDVWETEEDLGDFPSELEVTVLPLGYTGDGETACHFARVDIPLAWWTNRGLSFDERAARTIVAGLFPGTRCHHSYDCCGRWYWSVGNVSAWAIHDDCAVLYVTHNCAMNV